MKKILSLVLFASLFCVSPSWAVGHSRPCLEKDLVGTWQMRSINTKLKLDSRDPFAAPYQWFIFDAQGRFKQMTSSEPIAGKSDLIRQFEERIPTTRYALDAKGMITLTRIETPNPEVCVCTYVLEGVPEDKLAAIPEAQRWNVPQKGDLILTYPNGEGKPVLAKSLRRVKT
ncbi:MAG TPA: hypothetical protein VL404_04325 [Candidatus Eisenbacteria bacterium]|nr:hypothetical protein [Candidatus Eisenbacteria bacterium]